MRIKKKLRLLFLSCIVCCSAMSSLKVSAIEQEKTVEFLVHKRVIQDSEAGMVPPDKSGVQNNWTEVSKGQDGITFELYDVSSWVEAQLEKDTVEDIQKKIMNMKPNDLKEKFQKEGTFVAKEETKTVGEEAGIATFSVTSREDFSAWLFLEMEDLEKEGEIRHAVATPMLVVLPIENEGEILNPIHLYPKNSSNNNDEPLENDPQKQEKREIKQLGLPSTNEVKTMMSLIGVLIIAFILMSNKKKRKR